MKSLYKRQFAMMAGMILISFALLGGAFITLSYQYTVREKRDTIERNASDVARYTVKALSLPDILGGGIRNGDYQLYLSSVAEIAGAYVIVCTPTGEIALASGDLPETHIGGGQLPASVVAEMTATGTYAGMTTLDGLFMEKRYVAAKPILMQGFYQGKMVQQLAGIAVVAAEASSLTELWRAFATIFFFTSVVVLCIAFITSSVTSLKQTKPLKEIAEAARKFGHGEFEARVTGYECRRDEVGELADAFNAMADSLAKSEAKRSEFVANISHELKTPMTTIAGFTDGILDGTIPPERQRESLETVSSETRRLSRLVRRMLDLSRLQSSENVTAQEQFDVTEVLIRVLVSLETKINARHLDVETKIPDGPVAVWGDPDSITQVCYNLLDNAIKFSATGTALGIEIAAKGGKAHVSVRNYGETIAPEELPMVFDRFHKTDRSRSEDREGVGLGLYIVKTILGNHKENITVTSENGMTAFTFTLTLA